MREWMGSIKEALGLDDLNYFNLLLGAIGLIGVVIVYFTLLRKRANPEAPSNKLK